MNANNQIKIVEKLLSIFTKYNVSKLEAIAIMEVIKYDLLRQSSITIPEENNIPQHGGIA